MERARASGCRVFPGIEGQLHWAPGSGGGGAGIRPGNGVIDGFGPPGIEYARAVAANHYAAGADGISLFNFTCADGPVDRALFDELANPEALALKDKQYVLAVWPPDAQIYYAPWTSRFRLAPGETAASYPLVVADDPQAAARRCNGAGCHTHARLDGRQPAGRLSGEFERRAAGVERLSLQPLRPRLLG